MMVDVIVIKENQTHPLVDLFGVKNIEIKRDHPQLIPNYIQSTSTHGKRLFETTFDLFHLIVECQLNTSSFYNYHLKLAEIKALLYSTEPYYVTYTLEPGLRFKVIPQPLEVIRNSPTQATLTLTFDVFEGCAESIGTTLNAVDLACDWQFSMGIVAEDYQYIHQTHSFDIWNLGDITVDPREHDLIIQIEGVSEGDVTLMNETTGERFVYHPPLNTVRGEILTLDGVYPKINGRHCGIETNGGLISLVPGRNQIQVSGISRVKTSFEFRFRYK